MDEKEESSRSPPKPPKTSFMCFSSAKEAEILKSINCNEKEKDIIKAIAQEWRSLPPEEKCFWDEEARNDKLRYVREKASFTGQWNIPKRRAKKNPLAPKRPMSAFLKYSQTRRKLVKKENPDMSNTDVSRLLGEMWRNATANEKAPYVDKELKERAIYKAEIAEWRLTQKKKERDIALRKIIESDTAEQQKKNEVRSQKPASNALLNDENEYSRNGFSERKHYEYSRYHEEEFRSSSTVNSSSVANEACHDSSFVNEAHNPRHPLTNLTMSYESAENRGSNYYGSDSYRNSRFPSQLDRNPSYHSESRPYSHYPEMNENQFYKSYDSSAADHHYNE